MRICTFEGRARGEIAGPHRMRIICVGEHVIGADWQLDRCNLGTRIDGGRRVEGVDPAVQIDVMDDLVDVLEPSDGVLVGEIRSHHEHDIVAGRKVLETERRLHKRLHALVHVIVLFSTVGVSVRQSG